MSVIVPAHNEETTITACLAGIAGAARHLTRSGARIHVTATVVLDRCTDLTEDLARAAGCAILRTNKGCVGHARHLGAMNAITRSGTTPERQWLLSTDADSVVPEDWLVCHLHHAQAGADVVAGLVTPQASGLSPELVRHWHRVHTASDGHTHVFGANLGIRTSAYLALGGFPPTATGEDQALVDSARLQGTAVRATNEGTVETSSRLTGRAPNGFAQWLASADETRSSVDANRVLQP